MECDLEGIKVSYKIIGHGRPVLMLHGWPYDHTQMEYDMEPVFVGRSGWQRIYLDLPGMGRTKASSSVCSSDDILRLLEKSIDLFIADRRFLVAGMSYGGYLARGIVHRRWREIDGVLLSVPSAEYPPKAASLPARKIVTRNPSIATQARREMLGLFDQDDAIVTENHGAIEYARMLSAVVPADDHFLSQLRQKRQFSFDIDAVIQPLEAPALLIFGRQDHQVGYMRQMLFMENYPRATVIIADGAGHYVWGEKKSLCINLANEWLDRVMEWIGDKSGQSGCL